MRENLSLLSKIVVAGLQAYWRATRGIALSVEAVIIDAENRVAFVNANAGGVWRLPSTTVRPGEALADALNRLLIDDHRIRIETNPDLFWMYVEAPERNGQTAVFAVRQWHQDASPSLPGLAFFGLNALPADLPPQDGARIRQAIEGRAPFEVC
jgi:8-oxo-dGTP diphosphatase